MPVAIPTLKQQIRCGRMWVCAQIAESADESA